MGRDPPGNVPARRASPRAGDATVTLTHLLATFAAGFGGGTLNAIAGGGTLLTFPALIALGLTAKDANMTSTVALWPASLAGMLGFQSHLEGTRSYLVRLGVPSLVGGACGAALLLATPNPLFALLVPWLIFFSTALFMGREAIATRFRPAPRASAEDAPRASAEDASPGPAWWAGAMLFQALVGVYAGYFGAGAGILMLAVLGFLGISDIYQANGIKNYLGLCVNGVAVVAFVMHGRVAWHDVLVLAPGSVCGAWTAARLARRVGQRTVRIAVVVIGLTIGVVMLYQIGL